MYKIILASQIQTSLYLIRSHVITSKFYECLRIKCDKCNMVVIALKLVCLITLWSAFLYVLQELIKLVHGFVNHIHISLRNHLGTWYLAIITSSKRSLLRKGGDVIILTLNLMIMSIVDTLIDGFIDSKSWSYLHFFTSLPVAIQSVTDMVRTVNFFSKVSNLTVTIRQNNFLIFVRLFQVPVSVCRVFSAL